MAAPISDSVRVGMVVYRAYTPAVVGTIVAIVQPANRDKGVYWPLVRVKWDNPKRGVTEEGTIGLSNYEDLVLDHERKAVNHRAILERIRGTAGREG